MASNPVTSSRVFHVYMGTTNPAAWQHYGNPNTMCRYILHTYAVHQYTVTHFQVLVYLSVPAEYFQKDSIVDMNFDNSTMVACCHRSMRNCVNVECKIKTDPEIAVLFHDNQVILFLEVVLSSIGKRVIILFAFPPTFLTRCRS